MNENKRQQSAAGAAVLGLFILLGLAALGYLLGNAALQVKEYERSVTVKGLAEREYPADIVIWPIQFTVAENDLSALYERVTTSAARIRSFLSEQGVAAEEISVSAPAITDKSAFSYGGGERTEFRYVATQAVTVFSADVTKVRRIMGELTELGKQGIVIAGADYQNQTEYIFSRLNEVKPEMVEEATRNAREVAQKFAEDSGSTLGKIRRASQGQFSIAPRDTNNPHIKTVRVVSTIEYYLSD